MSVIYCANDPCETPATKFYRTESGGIMPLCNTCAGAFELGQVNPDADLEDINNLSKEPDQAEDDSEESETEADHDL